jgi:hypothetical protein
MFQAPLSNTEVTQQPSIPQLFDEYANGGADLERHWRSVEVLGGRLQ